MPRLLALLVFAAACGSKSQPAPAHRSMAGVAATDCPASFAAAPVGQPCDPNGTTCAYREGSCTCGPEGYCGGARPTQEILDALAKPHWQCTPVRNDGCPETPPTGACSEEGKTCQYGVCCVVPVTCTNGAWVAGDKSCPP